MREYREEQQVVEVVSKMICNCCGKEISHKGEDVLHIEKVWGYFSNKDGRQDDFDICEGCYDKWVATFAISQVK